MIKAEYIDHMGDDIRVVNAARVSFDKQSDWEEFDEPITVHNDDGIRDGFRHVKRVSGRDQKLISYLARHDHWTPFAHCVITLRETVPIFVARQRFKHMVGFTYNEVSRRYVDNPPEFYEPDVWRKRAEDKKQGSSEEPAFASSLSGIEKHHDMCKDYYHDLIDSGVAPEQARMVLPQSMLTSYYVTGSLAAWVRAYKLRIAPDSQKEIQDLAAQWGSIIAPLYPVSWQALVT